eukprot:gb/GECG01011642.1/.p1 GENE.gb/GECG01011642.1/~~gb/GECG01011642.1/.p1  ORF type:complete len:527 (+),score=70.66 gb/GECG01011642.1/:1-1581(+)
MAARVVRNCFDRFQRARMDFVSEVADLAQKPHYLECLLDEGAVVSLKKLLHDKLPTVQQTAAIALGRLAGYSTELAEELVTSDVLFELAESMGGGSSHYQKAGAYVIRCVAKHNEELAQCCVEAGVGNVLARCLEENDPGVREYASNAVATISSHSADLAQAIVDCGIVPALVSCAKEPDNVLKRACIAALAEIAKHTPELADTVADSGVLVSVAKNLKNNDAKVRRQTCSCIAQVSKHNLQLAELCVESGVFPELLSTLQDSDMYVRKNGAAAVREIVKQSEELASLVVEASGLGFLVDYMGDCHGNARLPAIMALGFIGSFSETLSMSVLRANGASVLKEALVNEPEDHIKAACVWALGQCGKHGTDHAQILAEADTLRHILACMLHEDSSEDLRLKSKRALKAILSYCRHLPALQPLLSVSPAPVQKAILSRFAEILPDDQTQRRELVASGGLKTIQSLDRSDPEIGELVERVNVNFPREVVEYCSPDFERTLMKKVEEGSSQGETEGAPEEEQSPLATQNSH